MTPQERALWVRQMGARADWWAVGAEPIIEPDLEVVDTHLHLWDERDFPSPVDGAEPLRTSRYLLGEFLRDARAGHRVTRAVYVECGSGYRTRGPQSFRPVGETEFAACMAASLAEIGEATRIAAIVAHADLRDPDLGAVLDAHEEAGRGLFRGIRQSGARLDEPSERLLAGAALPGLYADPAFRRGLAIAGDRGLTFDAFMFHFQLGELEALARAVPQATVIVNHLGAPVGYAGAPGPGDAVFSPWARYVEGLARLPNVVMKLGGMASIVTHYDGHLRDRPPSSRQFVDERGAYFRHAIDCFGAERCMFESNFPVDSASIGYANLWNAYKIIASGYGPDAMHALLAGTAQRVYRI